jgi:hypothetical protein
MTDKEKIEQKVRLEVEVQEALRDLAHERERALAYADGLEAWAKWLREQAAKQPSAADFMPTLDSIRADTRYQECLSYSTLLSAEEKIRVARQKASNLELRKMQLDSPPGFQAKI